MKQEPRLIQQISLAVLDIRIIELEYELKAMERVSALSVNQYPQIDVLTQTLDSMKLYRDVFKINEYRLSIF